MKVMIKEQFIRLKRKKTNTVKHWPTLLYEITLFEAEEENCVGCYHCLSHFTLEFKVHDFSL